MLEVIAHSEKSLLDLAEQVLLGLRKIEHLQELEEDDLARIQAAVRIGPLIWADEGRNAWAEAYAVRPIQVRSNDGPYIYVPDRSKKGLATIANQLEFSPFPFPELRSLETSPFHRLCEAWSRELNAVDIGIFLRSLAPHILGRVFDSLGDNHQGEWRYLMEKKWPSNFPGYEEEQVQKRVSCVILNFLKQEHLLPEIIEDYQNQIYEEIQNCLQSFPERMNLKSFLENFSELNWGRLAGFTPRDSMVDLAFVLPQNWLEKLTNPLPERQKPDLRHSIALAKKQQGNVDTAYQRLVSFKRWVAQLVKVASFDSASEMN